MTPDIRCRVILRALHVNRVAGAVRSGRCLNQKPLANP
jgi:hypothetical protein